MNNFEYEKLREDTELLTIVMWRDQYIGFLMDIAQFTDYDYKVLAEQLDNGTYKEHGQQLEQLENLQGLNQKIKKLKAEYLSKHDINVDDLNIIINFMSEDKKA